MRSVQISHLVLIWALGVAATAPAGHTQGPAVQSVGDEYSDRIKPIFESRCIACHSCYNAPCQLNLQSYSGVTRGAASTNVYNAQRTRSVEPTRIDIDARTPPQWRDKGFFDVLGSGDAKRSLLLRLTQLRSMHASAQPRRRVTESELCAPGVNDPRIAESADVLGMPYGLPPLSSAQIAALKDWIERGAPGPASEHASERTMIPDVLRGEVKTWEDFLNGPDARQQLVSRYIYEHLFLANLYFASQTPSVIGAGAVGHPAFFRLVRSRTACDSGIAEIATRRPTDAPGTPEMFYCLRPVTSAIADKKHVPFGLSPRKLERIKALFLGNDWVVASPQEYGSAQASNPFTTFAAIPVKARYQFLLDDAHFHISTFIKGPVCNGTAAVNSIQEQFFVFFLKPEADSMVMSAEHAAAAQKLLILPGMWGSDIALEQDLPFLVHLAEHRETYRKLRRDSIKKLRPNGYELEDIWNGDGINPNALLTVFRHDDNAAVVKGAVGDLPKTGFVLDYPLFERLVYNLVVNFDVFGNVGHQVLTRIYMDMIRMEAEELFLSFLPPGQRQRLRSSWYRGGLLTDVKLKYVFPLRNDAQPTAIKFRDERVSKSEFIQRVLFERLPASVRGPADLINWRVLRGPESPKGAARLPLSERALQRIASVPAREDTPFARYFPELAVVLMRRQDSSAQLYSIVHNREHSNVSWIMGEDLRLAPQEDTLTVREGVLGSYPNMFFVLDERQANDFSNAIAGITSPDGYDRVVNKYGVRRSSAPFWEIYDDITALALQVRPVEGGALDLSRYELEGR